MAITLYKDMFLIDDITESLKPEPEVVRNAVEDRQYLGWSQQKYREFAEALGNNCFVNKHGDHVSIKKCKTKKLKNVRAEVRRSTDWKKSMIIKELHRRLDFEIKKRNAPKR